MGGNPLLWIFLAIALALTVFALVLVKRKSDDVGEASDKLRENMEMIGGLATEYHAVYYYNISENIFKIYSLDEERFPNVAKIVGADIGPMETLHMFGKSPIVHPDDKYIFEAISVDLIKEKLAHTKKWTQRFRRDFDGTYLWTELEFIKYEDINEPANAIAVCFAERDAEIRNEMVLRRSFSLLNREISPDSAVNELLAVAGEYYGAERAYIFEYANKKTVVNNTYEWCAPSVEAMIDKLQEVPADAIDGWVEEFRRQGAFFMDSRDTEHNTEEGIALLEMQGIESLVAAPLLSGSEIVGFIGVDNPTLARDNIGALNTVSSIAYSEILRRKETSEETITLSKLTDMFLSVYYVDFTTDYMHNWKIDEFGEGIYGGVSKYSESMGDYVNNGIAERDRERCKEMTSPEYVLKQFETKDRFTVSMTDIMRGTELDYEFDFIKVSDDGNKFVISCKDVTESLMQEREQQKQLEAAEKSKKLIDSFSESYDIAYIAHLPDATYTILNPNKETLKFHKQFHDFNDALKFFVDKSVFHADKERMENEIKFETIRERIAKESTYSVQYRILQNGEVLWNEMTITAISGDDIAVGFISKDMDILNGIIGESLKNKFEGIWIAYLNNNQMRVLKGTGGFKQYEGKVIPHVETMKGFSSNLIGDDKEYFSKVYGDPEVVKEMLSKEPDTEYIYQSPNYGGELVWMKSEVHTLAYDENGVPEMAMVGITPMDSHYSERMELAKQNNEQKKRLEEQQNQLEEALMMAQSANRAKTTFLNNMSHDIRTPMNAIIGFTGLAASHIDNKEQVQDYLTKIGQSSDHLLSLINDVLDMSRIESGKMNINEKEESLPEIIHALRDIIQADIHSKEMDFFVDTIDVNDEMVICDKLRLNQVLLNILSNSVKYTPTGGTITLRIKEKSTRKTGYGSYEFLIKDTGIGMSQEFIKTIYDPFTRVNSSTVSGIQGTGLGMAITKNIIDMMGGTIEIASEEGVGTEVTLCFDFKLCGERKEPEKIASLTGLRALVVDDDTNACRSASKMLMDIGMDSDWCTSGKEAIIRTEEAIQLGNLFKVYIIDWLMPSMNGIETTRRIRKIVGPEAPIIILTSYDWSDIEDEAREAGVTEFISKPLFPSDLHKVLCKCCGEVDEAEDKSLDEYDFTDKKVLLVEDNELNREIATELLEEYGFIVDTAEDGSIAVEKMIAAEVGKYDIVLMDIQMPIMDGYEATRQIRKLGTEISKIPILAMTANAFEEDKKAALEAGMNAHIAKPINIEILKSTLAEFL